MFDNLKWETKALVMLLTICIGGISAMEDLSANLGVKSDGEHVSQRQGSGNHAGQKLPFCRNEQPVTHAAL